MHRSGWVAGWSVRVVVDLWDPSRVLRELENEDEDDPDDGAAGALVPRRARGAFLVPFRLQRQVVAYPRDTTKAPDLLVIPEGAGPVNPQFLFLIFVLAALRLHLGAPECGVGVKDRPGGSTASAAGGP